MHEYLLGPVRTPPFNQSDNGFECSGAYRMVGNFREGFIFVFFVSQEPFMKIKTVKFFWSTCKASEPHFNPAFFKLSSCPNSNRSLSASVSLKPSRKSKCYVSTDAQTGQRSKAESRSNHFYKRPGYEATFLPTAEQRADIAISISVNNSRHSFSFIAVLLANLWVPD